MITKRLSLQYIMPIITNRARKNEHKKKAHTGRKNSDIEKFDYNKGAWRRDRAAHLQISSVTGLSGRFCEHCLKKEPAQYTVATDSDHITPINQGGDAWDWANRQALCKRCHAIKSGREAHNRRMYE